MKTSTYLCLLSFFVLALQASALTYSNDVKPILDGNCIECHDGTGQDLDLTSFPFASSTLSSQTAIVDLILSKLEASPPQMPPGNRQKLSLDQVTTIQDWLAGGLAP